MISFHRKTTKTVASILLYKAQAAILCFILFCTVASSVQSDILDNSVGPDEEGISKSFHLVWRSEDPDKLYDTISLLRRNNYKKIYIGLTKSICLDFELWDCKNTKWNSDDLRRIIDFAKLNMLEVAIEIKMLNKVKKSFSHLEHMLYNKETLDPANQDFSKLYDQTFEYIAKALQIKEVLIGYDEIFGFSKKDRGALNVLEEQMLPPGLFMEGLRTAARFSERHGLHISIWGDMLIDNYFLKCTGSQHNHGSISSGYGQGLIEQIPPGITVILWYYKNTLEFCGAEQLLASGFTVKFAVKQPNETRQAVLAYAETIDVHEVIYTSFNLFRDTETNNATEVCEVLGLGDCID